ncbi:serpentine type 7TM GPCR chemoreceptor str domain-containing protein [Ditylenchus destructor]|nr:serpentine type 7TM GPCR chemoreceptor str domain-containing protein [Ditylenchus destructor]
MDPTKDQLYLPAGEFHFCYTTGFFNDAFKDAPLFTKIMFKTWFFFVYITLYTPGVQFLYRYLVLCREREPSYRLYATLFSFAAVFQLAFCIVSFGTTDYVPRTHNEPYQEYILTENPSNVDLLVSKNSLFTQTLSFVAGFVGIITYGIVIVCGIKIWLHLRRHFQIMANVNRNSRNLQTQINSVLILQAALPIVGIFTPVCIDAFGGLFKADAKDIIFIVQTVAIWMPVFNPLLTILLVESYRKGIFRCCKSEMSSTKVSNVTATNTNALGRATAKNRATAQNGVAQIKLPSRKILGFRDFNDSYLARTKPVPIIFSRVFSRSQLTPRSTKTEWRKGAEDHRFRKIFRDSVQSRRDLSNTTLLALELV